MPELDFNDAVEQLREQGATDADIAEFAQQSGVKWEPPAAQAEAAPGAAGDRSNLRIDPSTAKMYGGVLGGMAAAPFAGAQAATGVGIPSGVATELIGVGLGTAAGRQIAELWNKHVAGDDAARVAPGQQAADVGMDTLEGAAGGAAGASAGAVLERQIIPMAAKAWEGFKGMLPKMFGGDTAREELFKRALLKSMETDLKGSIQPGASTLDADIALTQQGSALTRPNAEAVAKGATAPGMAQAQAGTPGGRPEVLGALQRSGANLEGASPLVNQAPTNLGQWEALSKHPKTADAMKRSVDKTVRSLEANWDKTLARAGDTRLTREQAGGAVKTAIGQAGEAASGRQAALELKWRNDMGGAGGGVKIDAPATTEYLKQFDVADGPGMGSDFRKLYTQLQEKGGVLDLDGLRKWRTRAIRNGSQGSIISDADAGEWDGLVGALSKDFGDASAKKGGAAASSWRGLNDNWENWKTRSAALRQVANSPDGLGAFKAAFGGDRAALTRMRALKDTLPEQEWNDLGAAYLKDLSTDAKTGKLDIAKWFKNWGEMDGSLKDTLMRPGDPLRRSLDDMVTIGGAAKDAGYMRNFSNTASATLYLDALEGGGTRAIVEAIKEPTTIRGKVVGKLQDVAARQFTLTDADKARLLTNPDFVKWLAEGTKQAVKRPGDATGAALHLDRLGMLVGAGKIGPEIGPYLENLRGKLEQARASKGGESAGTAKESGKGVAGGRDARPTKPGPGKGSK